jgi:uncharacterized membrane protein YgcG
MKPSLTNADYGRAIEECIIHLDILLNSDKSEIESIFKSEEVSNYNHIGIIMFVLMWIAVMAFGWKVEKDIKKMEKGKEALNKLMREVKQDDDEEELRNNKIVQNEDNDAIDDDSSDPVINKFDIKSCPICLEDFPTKASKAVNKAVNKDYNNVEPNNDIENQRLLSSNTDINRPMALQCNHVFCYECLDVYLNSKDGNKCPICRTPVDINTPPTDDVSQGRRSCNTNTHIDNMFSSNCSWPRRSLEYRYRMNRLHHYYPNVVTSEVIRSMDSPLHNGSSRVFLQNLQLRSDACVRIISDHKTRAKASKSGKSGSSRSSFGGGRSGGGRGGGW